MPLVLLLLWLVFISVPLSMGRLGLSWDALNHHIYLGWSAESPRFGMDWLASSYQSYQYPFLYWPVYKLAAAGASGWVAGVVLSTLHLVVVPPVWMMARTCMPGSSSFDVAMRMLAVILGFMSAVVLKLFEATSNDLLAAAPLVWALALALQPFGSDTMGDRPLRMVVVSACLGGISVAFKLSNGPLVVLLPFMWVLAGGSLRERALRVLAGGLAGALAFALAYGYWGWQLWSHFGNPIYPFADGQFEPVRQWLGWRP
ncbi:MAG TPA: hypothetical protein VLI46_09405 [Ramlibacter sp.]|nr:hypothetical protein [Ramlibacter sp.]